MQCAFCAHQGQEIRTNIIFHMPDGRSKVVLKSPWHLKAPTSLASPPPPQGLKQKQAAAFHWLATAFTAHTPVSRQAHGLCGCLNDDGVQLHCIHLHSREVMGQKIGQGACAKADAES